MNTPTEHRDGARADSARLVRERTQRIPRIDEVIDEVSIALRTRSPPRDPVEGSMEECAEPRPHVRGVARPPGERLEP